LGGEHDVEGGQDIDVVLRTAHGAFQNKNFSHVSFWEGEILGLQARLSSTRRTPWNDALIRLKVRVQRLSETMP
jgi:hypothetical protein